MTYKNKSGAKIVAAMMDVATSGGYYISLPADVIFAHPTTVTGSVGVVFLIPKIDGLISKIGVDVDVHKSAPNKDMASPFRPVTEEERRILQDLTDQLGSRFAGLVKKHRNLSQSEMARTTTAQVFLAPDAKALGLIDEVGYLSQALSRAKKLAGLPQDARVTVYRRTQYANDNIYNPATSPPGRLDISLIDLNLPKALSSLDAGFYYLWLPASNSN